MALWFSVEISPGAPGVNPSVSDASFSVFATIADTGSGFSITQTVSSNPTLVPGVLYAYRCRRYDDASGLYSAYSPLVFARAPQYIPYTGEDDMPLDFTVDSVIVGGETELGIGIEPFEGCAVKAQHKFQYRSGGLRRVIAKLGNRILHDSPTQMTNYSPGLVTWEGQFDITWTPEGACPTILGALWPSTTTGTSGPSGTTIAPYTSTYKDLYGDYTVTLIHNYKGLIKVYPGCRVDGWTMQGIVGEVSDIVTVSFRVCALNEVVYDSNTTPSYYAALGMDTAGVDTLPPYSAVTGLASFAGELGKLRNLSFDVSRNLGKKKTLDGTRGISQHFATKTTVTLAASVYFQSLSNILRDFGWAINTATPVGVSMVTNAYALSVSLNANGPVNGNGYANVITFNANNVLVESEETVRDEREVDQMLTFTAVDVQGDASGTDVFITLINSLSATTLATAGTPIPNFPLTAATTYFSAAVNAAPSPTTTTFTANNANIPSQSTTANNPFYLQRNVYWVTGPNVGTYQPISAYVAPTGGVGGAYTLGSAAAFAPTTGDIFVIR